MDGKIPLPTDNIYKFYALFGLLFFISTMAAFVYLHKATNDLIFEAAISVEELESKTKLTPVEEKRKALIEKRVSVAVADKEFFNQLMGVAMGVALFFAGVGFWKWKTEVQPKQDKLLDLQIQKAEQELAPPPRKPFRGPNR